MIQCGQLCWQSENYVVANPPRSIKICRVLTGIKGRRHHKSPSQSTPSFNFIGKITPNTFAPIFQVPVGICWINQHGDPDSPPFSGCRMFRAHRTGGTHPGASIFLQTLGSCGCALGLCKAIFSPWNVAFHLQLWSSPRLIPSIRLWAQLTCHSLWKAAVLLASMIRCPSSLSCNALYCSYSRPRCHWLLESPPFPLVRAPPEQRPRCFPLFQPLAQSTV